MKSLFRLCCCLVLLFVLHAPHLLAQAAQQTAPPSIPTAMDDAVASYRKVIVLMDHADALDEGNHERVRNAAWILFEQNHERLEKLDNDLRSALAQNDPNSTASFLERLESTSVYHDADKLVFRDLLDGLAALAPPQMPSSTLQKRIADDVAALDKIHNLYQKEVSQIFGDVQTRAMPVRREAWERYLTFLKSKYRREDILKEYASQLPPAQSRGGASPRSSLETFGTALPENTFVLTFDDGPHPRYTDQVLAVLKSFGLHAVFFEVGKNLGTVNDKNEVTLGPIAGASYRILQSGSVIANHSYSHPVLPKLTEAGYTKEIDSTNALLTYIGKSNPILFRPPYGATNDAILEKIHADNMQTIIWNIDSEDWADPVPNSVAQRVLTEAHKWKKGIILFHDIHKVGLEALPNIITTLQSEGAKFAVWNGSAFAVPDETRGDQNAAAPAPAAVPVSPYHDSWAAIIGIDDYANWQKLRYATHDAQGMKDLLLQKYNFKPDHIFTLLDGQATRQNILSLLGDKLASPDLVQHDDRVLIFFAGHGATCKLASGRDLGYIIPVDADLSNFEGSAISMTNFQDISEAIPAKHVLFLMDSCYSGLALTRGGPALPTQNYLNEMSRREAREMFTAGGADQQVADNGPNGHSIFTWTLLQGLDGRADLNGDGVITATELAAYVAPAVSALSHQTPAFGNLPGSEGGDFLFDWKHDTEFLNEDSAQLGDDAIKVNGELAQLRTQMKEELRKNEELRKELQVAQEKLKQGSQPSATTVATNVSTPASVGTSATSATESTGVANSASATTEPAAAPARPSETAASLNDEGMRLYKEKQYPEAAAKFVEASKLRPASALFANNAGFAYFRMSQFEEAVKWFQQAIVLDPKRAIAYLNLGDAYSELQKKGEARGAYEKFLAISPDSKSAPAVRERLKSL
jgi:peptidoglycan/xylan/chitin deacetylase (PgdA/CDA1 family)/TolA-binding protein